jgi:hypothetical protein
VRVGVQRNLVLGRLSSSFLGGPPLVTVIVTVIVTSVIQSQSRSPSSIHRRPITRSSHPFEHSVFSLPTDGAPPSSPPFPIQCTLPSSGDPSPLLAVRCTSLFIHSSWAVRVMTSHGCGDVLHACGYQAQPSPSRHFDVSLCGSLLLRECSVMAAHTQMARSRDRETVQLSNPMGFVGVVSVYTSPLEWKLDYLQRPSPPPSSWTALIINHSLSLRHSSCAAPFLIIGLRDGLRLEHTSSPSSNLVSSTCPHPSLISTRGSHHP